MATLSGTIDKQEIMDRFRDYLEVEANNSIVWWDNNRPTMDTSPVSAGTTAVVDTLDANTTRNSSTYIDGNFTITDTTFTNGTDQVIRAGRLFNKLYDETAEIARWIRKLRVKGRVEGAGGNSGTRLRNYSAIAGRTYIELTEEVQVAYLFGLNNPYQGSLTASSNIDNAGIAIGSPIDDQGLETFFSNLREAFRTSRDTIVDFITQVCHSSCHSSCHGARGRR